jgi:hypothetical protein
MFQDPASSNSVQFAGQAVATLTGVVYTPDALVSITGNGNVTINHGPGTATLPPILGALIAFDLKVDGNGVLTINADDPPAAMTRVAAAAPASTGLGGGSPGNSSMNTQTNGTSPTLAPDASTDVANRAVMGSSVASNSNGVGAAPLTAEMVRSKGSIAAGSDAISPQLVDQVFSDLGQIV